MNVLRFHLDEDSESRALVRALRLRGVDVTRSAETGLSQADDQAQLLWATENGRVIVTHNAGDFCRLHGEFLNKDQHHAGIIIIEQQRLSVGERMRRLLRLSAAVDRDAMRDRLEFLTHW